MEVSMEREESKGKSSGGRLKEVDGGHALDKDFVNGLGGSAGRSSDESKASSQMPSYPKD